jgi:hypothetical protein
VATRGLAGINIHTRMTPWLWCHNAVTRRVERNGGQGSIWPVNAPQAFYSTNVSHTHKNARGIKQIKLSKVKAGVAVTGGTGDTVNGPV